MATQPGPWLAVCLVALAGLIGTGRPAAADEPGLLRLIPLISLCRTDNPTQPPGDVAWIRCAALYYAQLSWHQNHGAIVGPSRAQRDDIGVLLRRSEQLRTTEFKPGDASPTLSVDADYIRLTSLYTTVFVANATQNKHPWQADAVVKYDMIYCDSVGGRR